MAAGESFSATGVLENTDDGLRFQGTGRLDRNHQITFPIRGPANFNPRPVLQCRPDVTPPPVVHPASHPHVHWRSPGYLKLASTERALKAGTNRLVSQSLGFLIHCEMGERKRIFEGSVDWERVVGCGSSGGGVYVQGTVDWAALGVPSSRRRPSAPTHLPAHHRRHQPKPKLQKSPQKRRHPTRVVTHNTFHLFPYYVLVNKPVYYWVIINLQCPLTKKRRTEKGTRKDIKNKPIPFPDVPIGDDLCPSLDSFCAELDHSYASALKYSWVNGSSNKAGWQFLSTKNGTTRVLAYPSDPVYWKILTF